ncbi:SapC family protein [Thalassotalea castellviae]|uniref:SapC family protein n=1 Tax=Thalassotalea castellviae TaxID=3075612 RepID=A0ABU3A2I3_9GAMM|nr:SapC family protein [Thalassotalea sp. W431]MDT0604387.1 SapC family protein [Thalassotalea sp. W431]
MNIVAIKKEQHQNLKVANQRDLSHVANQHIAPINVREFPQASTSYPIVLIKDPDSERYRTVVMLGLEAGENLYHEEKKWQAIYIPHSISMVPFSLGLDPEKEKTLTACIDLDSPFVGEDKDQALFDADGNDTEYFKGIQEQLGRLYDNEVANENFVKILLENDLLQELELNIAFNNEEKKKLVGIFGINEEKLHGLSDEKALEFYKSGLFMPIHAMLASAGQVNRLAQLRNASENPVKVSGIQYSVVKAEEAK